MNLKQFGAHILAATLVMAPLPGIAAEPERIALTSPVVERPSDFKTYELEMDRTSRMLKDLRSSLNRSTFDLEAVLDELDYDAEQIVRFAKQEITYEPYAGTLRGALETRELFAPARYSKGYIS